MDPSNDRAEAEAAGEDPALSGVVDDPADLHADAPPPRPMPASGFAERRVPETADAPVPSSILQADEVPQTSARSYQQPAVGHTFHRETERETLPPLEVEAAIASALQNLKNERASEARAADQAPPLVISPVQSTWRPPAAWEPDVASDVFVQNPESAEHPDATKPIVDETSFADTSSNAEPWREADFVVTQSGTAIPAAPIELTPVPTAATFKPLAVDVQYRPAVVTPLETKAEPRSYSDLARRAAKIIALCFAGWIALIICLIIVYRFVDPPFSALMLQHRLFGESVAHRWADIDDISPSVVRAVVMSEDARFCEHRGVDFEAIEKVIGQKSAGTLRGASTISMQVIKNLFLWPSRSIVRKAIEFPLTFVLEVVWPKRRIMEVYLNIAEWGPGVFGIATASEFHFNKPPSRLNEREAARLAVALPNPLARDAGRPGPGTLRLAQFIQYRMRTAPLSQTACVNPPVRR